MHNEYVGQRIKLTRIIEQTNDINLYDFEVPKNHFKIIKKNNFIPGQFIILSIPGVGEAPFAPCSSPNNNKSFQLCIKKVGLVTDALNNIKPKTELEYRGPYGNGFPINKMKNKDIVLIAGGTGIAPIASLIEYLMIKRMDFDKINLLYGAKKSNEILFKERMSRWKKFMKILLCIEEYTKEWKDSVGLVSDICCKIDTDPKKTIVIMCGPPIMYKNTYEELKKNNIKSDQVYVSMEARMKCGIGKCQHCTIGKKYTCLDGPIFRYDEIIEEL